MSKQNSTALALMASQLAALTAQLTALTGGTPAIPQALAHTALVAPKAPRRAKAPVDPVKAAAKAADRAAKTAAWKAAKEAARPGNKALAAALRLAGIEPNGEPWKLAKALVKGGASIPDAVGAVVKAVTPAPAA